MKSKWLQNESKFRESKKSDCRKDGTLREGVLTLVAKMDQEIEGLVAKLRRKKPPVPERIVSDKALDAKTFHPLLAGQSYLRVGKTKVGSSSNTNNPTNNAFSSVQFLVEAKHSCYRFAFIFVTSV